ncbi:MAG: ATP-binding protein [Breznakibacter sp.]
MIENNELDNLRNKIIGLGENSARKSFFPELQRKIKELEESESNLLALFNNTFDAAFVVDLNGMLLNVNSSMLQMFAMPNKDTALAYSLSHYLLDLNCCPSKLLEEQSTNEKPKVFECKSIKPLTKEVFDAEVAINPTPWYGQNAVLVLVRDISFRKRSEAALLEREYMLKQQNEELMALNEELAESNRQIIEMNEKLKKSNQRAIESDKLKTAFLANMSHEIRTPMNGIVGFATLMTMPGNDPEAMTEYAGVINSCSQQLLTIINDILDIAKIEAGQITVVPVETNLNNLLKELYAFFQNKPLHGVGFALELPPLSDGVMLRIDPDRLKQILSNLLSNAFKFTHQGRVVLGYTIHAHRVTIFVTDTGIGIETKKLQKIFKRFHQVNSEGSKNYGGTGLGLAISKALVGLMGGRIKVESKLGIGSRFKVELPL